MKKCINCGCELADEAMFCGECGTKQESPKQFCANCGTQLPAGTKFCGECGTPVSGLSVPTPEPQPAQTPQPVAPAPQPKPEVEVCSPDGDTLSITYRGIPFSLKLVSAPDRDFYIGETPVTQALWLTLMGNNPSEDNGDLNYPVTNITPSQATSFLVRLQKIFGVKFELPTPEQWGLARSGGHKSEGYKYAGSNDINEVAWTDGELHPVGELFANELGLLDMDGNVEELLKGGEVSLLNPDESDNKNDADFTGLRFVVNLTDSMSGDKPLQQAIAANAEYINARHEEAMLLYARILEEAEAVRKAAEKAAAEKAAKEEAERKAAAEKATAEKARLNDPQLKKTEDERKWKLKKEGKKYGFMDMNGNWRIKPIYEKIYGIFREERVCAVKYNGKIGFIDRNGNWIVKPTFDDIDDNGKTPFFSGIASVKIKDKWGYIDSTGKWILRPKYDDVYRWHSTKNIGMGIYKHKDMDGYEYKTYYIVERNGNTKTDDDNEFFGWYF